MSVSGGFMAFDKRKALQAALAYIQQGRLDKAIAEYETILKVDPNDFAVNNALGDLYARKGDTAEAIARYLRLGELYRADGDLVKAIAVYKKVLKLNPQNIEASLACASLYAEQGLVGEAKIQYMGIAEQYAKRGETRKALEVYQRIVDLEPGSSALVARLADMFVKEGMIQEAITQLSRGAQVAQKLGHTGEAVQLLKRVVQLDPDSFEAHYHLGRLLFQGGNYDEAIQELNLAASIDPTNVQPLAFLGQAYEQKGLFDQAVTVYGKIVDLDPRAPEPRLHLGRIFLQQGRLDDAFDQYDLLAERFIAQDKLDSACELFRGILDVAPMYPKARRRLAELLVRGGQLERAKEEFIQLAVLYAEAGQLDEERAVYERILAIDPEDSLARSRLQDMEAEGGPGVKKAEGELAVQRSGTLEGEEASPAPPVQRMEESGELAQIMAEAVGLEGPGDWSPVEEPWELQEEPLEEEAVLAKQNPSAGEERSTNPLQVEIPEREVEVDLEGDPLVSEALVEAEVYLKYGLYERAINRLKATSIMFPENILLHSKLKDLYLSQGLVGEGVGEALAIAELYLQDGRISEATIALQEVLTLAPSNERAKELLQSLALRQSSPGIPLPPSLLEPSNEESALEEDKGESPKGIEIEEEELPEEVQTFFEEDRESPVGDEGIHILLEEPSLEGTDLSEDLAEAEFYLRQGMYEEARMTYERILAKDPQNREAKTKLASLQPPSPVLPEAEEPFRPPEASLVEELLDSEAGFESPLPQKEAPEEPVEAPASGPAFEEKDRGSRLEGVVPIFKVMEGSGEPGEEGFFDLSAAILHELEAEEAGISRGGAGPTLEEILAEFQKGIREHLTEEDYETHYNLGIAYKEMELYDEAIEEFRIASKDRKRFISCAHLIGLCYLAKGIPERAIETFLQGISVQGFPSEESRGVKYDLATAYEAIGDLQRASAILQELQAEDPGFRDVRARFRDLQGRLARQAEPRPPNEPSSSTSGTPPPLREERTSQGSASPSPAEPLPPSGTKKPPSKDKISFI